MEFIVVFAALTLAMFVVVFFSIEYCLPQKRKFHNMLDDIKIYQDRYNDKKDVEFQHKGKTFRVKVESHGCAYSYECYDVYINGEKVLTYHVLDHLWSKSRERYDCGDRLSYEVDEILFVARKYANKTRHGIWDERYNSKSYF
jgi:hypothetical protein